MTLSAPSADDIKSAFTYPTLTTIVGEPTYQTIYKLEMQATRNAATVSLRLPPPHTNCSGLVEQPAIYVMRVGAPFPRPRYPGDHVTIPANAKVTKNADGSITFDGKIFPPGTRLSVSKDGRQVLTLPQAQAMSNSLGLSSGFVFACSSSILTTNNFILFLTQTDLIRVTQI